MWLGLWSTERSEFCFRQNSDSGLQMQYFEPTTCQPNFRFEVQIFQILRAH